MVGAGVHSAHVCLITVDVPVSLLSQVWRGDEVVDKSLWVKLKIDEDSCR